MIDKTRFRLKKNGERERRTTTFTKGLCGGCER